MVMIAPNLCDDEDVTRKDILSLGFDVNDVFFHKSKSFRKGHHVEFIPSIEEGDKEFYFIDLKPRI